MQQTHANRTRLRERQVDALGSARHALVLRALPAGGAGMHVVAREAESLASLQLVEQACARALQHLGVRRGQVHQVAAVRHDVLDADACLLYTKRLFPKHDARPLTR